jgi:hypothetical protein
MNKEIFKYLENHYAEPEKVNKLIVSNFIYSNNLENTVNKDLKKLLIKMESPLYSELELFLSIHRILNVEELIKIFEFVVSPLDRIVTGAIYTPNYIREYILENIFNGLQNFDNVKICDPACGCSAFLLNTSVLIRKRTNKSYKVIFEENLFGLDIQEHSIERSKLVLTLFALSEGEDFSKAEFNLFTGNALNFVWSDYIENFNRFQYVIGNPPYVCSRNLDEESKELLKDWSVCSTGHPDLYIPFFEIGLSILDDNGKLGFITMNTFFKSINGRALREYFKNNNYKITILDFGSEQVFSSKSTYTCLCFISKIEQKYIEYSKLSSKELQGRNKIALNRIKYSELDSLSGWNLQSTDVINKIESIGIPLGEKFRTRNGIATLKNNIYIFSPVSEDDNYYYLQNGSLYPIEKEICSDIINPNKLAKDGITKKIRQKIILPYKRSSKDVELIKEELFKVNFPKAYEYLESKKTILATRDKGKGNYKRWYAFGRNQSLEQMRFKLFFPHISSKIPDYLINKDKNLLFYNGLALIAKNNRDLEFMKKIMSSRLFWFYVTKSSKPYGSGYYSLSRTLGFMIFHMMK